MEDKQDNQPQNQATPENPNQENQDMGAPQQAPAENPEEVHQPKSDTEPQAEEDKNTSPEVQEELSKVAATPKSNILVFALIGVGLLFIIWNIIWPMLFGEAQAPKATDRAPRPSEESIARPSADSDSAPPIPQLPEPPKLVIPSAPEEPEEAPAPEPEPQPAPVEEKAPAEEAKEVIPNFVQQVAVDPEEAMQREEMKRKAPIQLIAGTPPPKVPQTEGEVQQANSFKKRGDLNYVLGKGKIIDVVTENAINSDFESEIRAVVVRDVYSESGKLILIPKGTRVFGKFTVNATDGLGRVDVAWNRMDLASGYTLTLAGDGVDNLGRKGVMGRIDNKYKEKMANVLMASAFKIGVAAAVDRLIPPVEKTEADANSSLATNVQSTALSTFQNAGLTAQEKITRICADVQNLMTDKSSAAYTAFVTSCTTAQGFEGAADDRLSTLMTAVSTAATSVITATNKAATPTKRQKAAEEAFQDISDTAKEMLPQQVLQPTVTIDQGHPIKIYVNKDYLFPKDAVAKTRVIK